MIEIKHKWCEFIRDIVSIPFADSLCLTFNYKEMCLFAKKSYKDMINSY